MANKKRTIISYAMFGMLLIVFGIYTSYYPRIAEAQTFQVITGFQYPIVAMAYQPTTDLMWVLTQNTTNQKSFLYWVDRQSKTILGSSNLTQMIITRVGSSHRVHDIDCGKTDCFVTSGNGGVTGHVFKISSYDISPNIFRGKNITGNFPNPVTNAGFWHILVEDNVISGFGSIRLYVGTCSEDEATCDYMVRVVNGITMTDTGIFTIFDLSNIAGKREHGMRLLGNSAVSGSQFALIGGLANVDTSDSAKLFLYDSDMVAGCVVQPTPPVATTPLSVDVKFVDYNSPLNRIYVGGVDGNVYVYNKSCTLIQSLTTNDTGLSGDIRFIDYDAGNLFMQESGGSARISQLLTDSNGDIIVAGSPNIYFPQPLVSQTSYDSTFVNRNIGDQMILLAGNGQLWFIYTGIDKRVGVLTLTIPAGQGTTVCIDTNPLANFVNLTCFTDNNGDGIPDSTIGQYPTVPQNVTTSGYQFGCQIGLVKCSNPDSKTNGVGLLFMLLLLLASIGTVMFVTFRTDKSLGDVHPVIWFIVVVAVTGVSWQLGWTDALPFFASIVAICALGAFKVREWFG